jgi:hypothetical protein
VSRTVRAFAVAAGALTLALGLWAFLSPQSFYDQIATWPPYNKHFLHDVGAFQAGLGATLILAAFVGDALVVALSGAALGSVIHALAHFIDRANGGRSSDPAALGLLAALFVIAAIFRARELRER